MRKILNTMLVLLMLLSLTACSNAADPQGQTESTDETTVPTNIDEPKSDAASSSTDKQEMPTLEQEEITMGNSIYLVTFIS